MIRKISNPNRGTTSDMDKSLDLRDPITYKRKTGYNATKCRGFDVVHDKSTPLPSPVPGPNVLTCEAPPAFRRDGSKLWMGGRPGFRDISDKRGIYGDYPNGVGGRHHRDVEPNVIKAFHLGVPSSPGKPRFTGVRLETNTTMLTKDIKYAAACDSHISTSAKRETLDTGGQIHCPVCPFWGLPCS